MSQAIAQQRLGQSGRLSSIGSSVLGLSVANEAAVSRGTDLQN
jgi:hypothetical protein